MARSGVPRRVIAPYKITACESRAGALQSSIRCLSRKATLGEKKAVSSGGTVKPIALIFFGVVLLAVNAPAQNEPAPARTLQRPLRPLDTFSLEGRDTDTGDMGVGEEEPWVT